MKVSRFKWIPVVPCDRLLFWLPVGPVCKPPRGEDIKHIVELPYGCDSIGEFLRLAVNSVFISRELEKNITEASNKSCTDNECNHCRNGLFRNFVYKADLLLASSTFAHTVPMT